MVGYTEDLLILPFDHRDSLLRKLFGIENRKPTQQEAEKYADLKFMVYEGFLKSLHMGVPKEHAAILVDEEFGANILADAKILGIKTAMPIEKSGQKEFDFDHQDFKSHIKRVDPFFVKVLVRFNPHGDKQINERQLERLKQASDFSHSLNKKFIFELLVPAEQKQLDELNAKNQNYDLVLRPKLMVEAIKEIQNAGIEPDVWKLEGVAQIEDSKALVTQAHAGGRDAGIITLGRGEDAEKVKEWLKVGAKVKGIIGFAVGRTVFWDAMKGLNDGKLTREQAAQMVADNYKTLVDLWIQERK